MKKTSRRNDRRSAQKDRRHRSSRELAIIYEDDAVVALNKPAGLPAVPVPGSDTRSAWSLLSAELRRRKQRAFVVHRIDRFTSGLLLFAKTEPDRAELRYVVERRLRAASLVRVTLVTGLQNQIRVQFSAIGHPVIGDRKYHPEEASERRIARVALHALHLEFIHPRSRENISLDCAPPPDFQRLLQALSPARPHR